jgi:hypothetical protein
MNQQYTMYHTGCALDLLLQLMFAFTSMDNCYYSASCAQHDAEPNKSPQFLSCERVLLPVLLLMYHLPLLGLPKHCACQLHLLHGCRFCCCLHFTWPR